MNRKPSRTFVSLALIMVFVLMIGLVVVGMLATSDLSTGEPSLYMTVSAILATNSLMAENIAQTQTATFMPVYYTADMSPTALPYFTGTPTPAPSIYGYHEGLSEAGQTAVWILMTSGGPDEYATFFAQETAFSSVSQTVQSLTATLTPSPTALPTNTALGSGVVRCAYSWAHRDLPDVAVLAQNALESAGIANNSIRADAYGEECINFSTNTVVSFGAMTTDFYVTAQLPNLNFPNTLANYVMDVYAVLSDLDQDSLPARLGYLDFTFTSGTTTKYLRTTFDNIEAALDKNLSGQKLLDVLGGLR